MDQAIHDAYDRELNNENPRPLIDDIFFTYMKVFGDAAPNQAMQIIRPLAHLTEQHVLWREYLIKWSEMLRKVAEKLP
jgi:hypothetical protein